MFNTIKWEYDWALKKILFSSVNIHFGVTYVLLRVVNWLESTERWSRTTMKYKTKLKSESTIDHSIPKRMITESNKNDCCCLNNFNCFWIKWNDFPVAIDYEMPVDLISVRFPRHCSAWYTYFNGKMQQRSWSLMSIDHQFDITELITTLFWHSMGTNRITLYL